MTAAICGAAALTTTFACETAAAQTAHFAGAQTTVTSSAFVNPSGLAVDASGNLYIADTGNNRVLKETLSAGSYTETTVPSTSLSSPLGVAVDQAGNVYIADTGNNRIVKENFSASGYIETPVVTTTSLNGPAFVAVDASGAIYIADTGGSLVLKETSTAGTSYTESTVNQSSLSLPLGLAVDGSGNVYISDSGHNRVLKETLSAGAYAESTIVSAGLNGPDGIALDASGNVYIVDTGNNRVLKEALSKSTYTASTLAFSNLAAPSAIALDASGNILVADTGHRHILKLLGTGVDFGAVSLGQASNTAVSLNFIFDSPGSPGSLGSLPAVLTQGASNLDFDRAITGSCTTTSSYSLGDICSVDVTFAPKLAGTRYGAATLQGSSGNTIATGYVQGTGAGPQVAFSPGVETSIGMTPQGSNLGSPYGLAADAIGNVYIADFHNDRVLKEVLSGGSYTPTTAVPGLTSPVAITVDGSGNLYVVSGGSQVFKETLSSGSYTQSSIPSSALHSSGVAVDGSGNVYVLDRGATSQVLKETLSGASYAETMVDSSPSLWNAFAVDGSGNVYLAEDGGQVLKETLSSGSYAKTMLVTTPLSRPGGIAIDGSGNIYISDSGNNRILKETFSAGNYSQSVVATGTLDTPVGVALDGSGNMYIASNGDNRVLKEDFGDSPSLSFATTKLGATSSAQTIRIQNIGNAPLTFPLLTSGMNPLLAANFTLDSTVSAACPPVGASSPAAETLQAGASCILSISFAPTTVGALSGALVLTDTNLNAAAPAYATQRIALSGTAIPVDPTQVSVSALPVSTPVGQAVTIRAAVSDSTQGSTTTGGVTFIDTVGAATASLNGGAPVQLSNGIAVLSLTPSTVGTHTITANYAGVAGGFAASTGSTSLVVTPLAPNLTFAPIPNQTYGTAPFAVSAKSASSGAVTYVVVSGPATVAGNIVTLSGTGTVMLKATQAAIGNYAAATASTSFGAVSPAAAPVKPILSFAPIASQTYGAAPFAVSATSNSSGAVTYAVVSGPATVAGNMVTLTGTGTVVLSASQAANGNYAAATANATFSVAPAFTLASGATGTSGSSKTVAPGGLATFDLMLTPGVRNTFANAVTFSAAGLPSGATATFAPATIAAGSKATPVVLTIQTSTQTARNEVPSTGIAFVPVAFGLTLLPLLGIRSARKRLLENPRLLPAILFAMLSLGTALSLSGCGGGSSQAATPAPTPSPVPAPPPTARNYSIVVTAKDQLTRVQSVVNLTLVVQ